MHHFVHGLYVYFFFFNDTATTEIYTLSLHDALPIYAHAAIEQARIGAEAANRARWLQAMPANLLTPTALAERASELARSEEHTSELQSRQYLVCRLLLEKKKTINIKINTTDLYKPPN